MARMAFAFGLSLVAACTTLDADGRGGAISVGASVHGDLTTADPAMDQPGRTGRFRSDLWYLDLTAGQTVTVSLCERSTGEFDPFLSIAADGQDVHVDDNSGHGMHDHGAMLTFSAAVTGTYEIYASTTMNLMSDTVGKYTLQVQSGDVTGTFTCPH